MDRITDLIVKENELKFELKSLKKEIQELIIETELYKSVYEAALEVPNVEVTPKVAKSHSIKVVYSHCQPSDEAEE
jgi:hypothetical protein